MTPPKRHVKNQKSNLSNKNGNPAVFSNEKIRKRFQTKPDEKLLQTHLRKNTEGLSTDRKIHHYDLRTARDLRSSFKKVTESLSAHKNRKSTSVQSKKKVTLRPSKQSEKLGNNLWKAYFNNTLDLKPQEKKTHRTKK